MVQLANARVQRIPSQEIPWLPYPLYDKSFWRVLHVDQETNTVILNFDMGPWVTGVLHGHHCKATAYTLSGAWFYDHLAFGPGDIAFEDTAETHQLFTREEGATFLTTLIGGRGNDRLLEDHNPDGSRTLMRTRLFKACERISLEDYEKLDLASLMN